MCGFYYIYLFAVAPPGKCSVSGCFNEKTKNKDKHFFWCPTDQSQRALWLFAVGKVLGENTKFTICQDHFDMVNDIRAYRVFDGRPVLKDKVIPHLNMNDEGNISASGRSTHNVFYNHQTTQTYVRKFRSIEVQTDPIGFGVSLGSKRKCFDMPFSLGSSVVDESSSSPYQSAVIGSDSTCERNLNEIEKAEEDEFGYDKDNADSGLSEKEKAKICDFTMTMMQKNLSHYTGIPQKFSYAVDLISEKSGVSKSNILLVLRKIRHNESLIILGDAFGTSRKFACRTFATDTQRIATCLQPFICWPETSFIIIGCLEMSIGKPKKPLDQTLSWSQDKHCNTIKYLIGCTSDGIIIFISKGFFGRISDEEIVRGSGLLNHLKQGMVVIADSSFKELQSEISLIDGILIKPSNVTADAMYPSDEAKLCKSIAAISIHVETIIRKIRNFAFLKSHHSLHSSPYLLEHSLMIASAICNMPRLLTEI